jgi:FtsP/CotA-like multicopper oxidase with cupredoxin domain
VDAGGDRRHLSIAAALRRNARTGATALVLAFGVASFTGAASAGASPPGRTIDYWVAAVPVVWNVTPNGRDAITGETIPLEDSVISTVVYRRYSPHWRKPEPNAPRESADGLVIPGPLIQARVGDHLRIHFKNLDTLRNDPHSMHFHGVHYQPSSDGSYVPGFSGRDGNVKPGQTYTYRLTAGEDSAGVWPYHDHSPSMMESIGGGMFGMLSILGRNERPPDREFEVVLAPMGKFMTIDGRAFVGNTPVFHAKVGDLVQWDVMALGSDFHTFHVHGHRWTTAGGVSRDTQTVGPAESFRIRWREGAPGTWLYHCHVEDHMMKGMIGIYRVTR